MITLAIDPSTKSTGIALFEDQELKKYKCITASSSNIFARIDKMIQEINNILTLNKIDKVVIEDVYPEDVKNNINIYKKLTYLQGFILHILDKHEFKDADIKFYTASEWRKKCGIRTGRGIHRESLKPKDIQFVKNQFGLTVNDDIADAICIGFAAVGGVIKVPEVIVDNDGFEFG